MKIGECVRAIGRSQFEYRTQSIGAIAVGKSVDVSVPIESELVVRAAIAATEAIERSKCPVVRQFVHRAATVQAAIEGSAVEIARRIEDQAANGILSIIKSLEVVQDGFFPAGVRV